MKNALTLSCQAIAVTCLLLATPSRAADQADVVHWYVPEFPPIHILVGEQRGKGYGDAVLDAIEQSLPAFAHKRAEAATPRILEQLKREANACHPTILHTPEREAFVLFSKPTLWMLPNGAVIRARDLDALRPHLDAHGDLKLESVLAGGGTRLAVNAARSFGVHLDALLKRYPDRIVTVPAADRFGSRLMKLANQRDFDIILGYPGELRYFAKQNKVPERDFRFLSLAEESVLIPGRTGCAKTAQGERIIAAIDKALSSSTILQRIEDNYLGWLEDDELIARYRKLRRQVRGG